MRMAAKMMESMSPEDMERMTQVPALPARPACMPSRPACLPLALSDRRQQGGAQHLPATPPLKERLAQEQQAYSALLC